MTKPTNKQVLDNLIVELHKQGVAPWQIAYGATQDGHYLSANQLTDYSTSMTLRQLVQQYNYTEQMIAQLLNAHHPKMDFPDKIVSIVTHLIERQLEPSVIAYYLAEPSHMDSSLATLYGYVIAHTDQNHILNELYSLACKLQRNHKDAQNGHTIRDLYEKLKKIFNYARSDIGAYHDFEKLVKDNPAIRDMIASVVEQSSATSED